MLGMLVFLVVGLLCVPAIVAIVRLNKADDSSKVSYKGLMSISGIGFLLLVVLLISFNISENVWWFKDVGFSSVYWTGFWYSLILLGIYFVVSLAIFIGCSWYVKRAFYQLIDNSHSPISPIFEIGVYVAFVVVAFVVSAIASAYWEWVALYFNAVTTGQVDPIFGKDMSFYLFGLPFWKNVVMFVIVTVSLGMILAVLNFAIRSGELKWLRLRDVANEYNQKMFLMLGVFVIFSTMVMFSNYFFARYSVLTADHALMFGASYTDVNFSLPYYNLMLWLTGLVIVAQFVFLFKKKIYFMAYLLAGILVISAVSAWVVRPIYQHTKVTPSELDKETPYLLRNIEATRQAFGLSNVEIRDYPATNDLTKEDLITADETISNVRLWDWESLKLVYAQKQEMRSYYEFLDVDLDRYTVNGQYRQVMLSAREMMTSQLQENSQSWVNLHFKYTHGYGLCMNFVNEFTSEGEPRYVIENIPTVAMDDELTVSRPEIYFGEAELKDIYVNALTDEFDYPMGQDNTSCRYEGKAGIQLNGWYRQFVMAWKNHGWKQLFSEYVNSETRFIMHRNIIDRVKKIAPFMYYDSDPYLVLHEGRLFWMMDAFLTSDKYPYSQPTKIIDYHDCGPRGCEKIEVNYIRNSVKVVIDAYEGTVKFYVVDSQDPLIRTWQAIYPEMFVDVSEMPENLQRHMRYPEDLFTVQAQVYSTYHMSNPVVFYNKEDVWRVALEIKGTSDDSQLVDPYFVNMSLDNETVEYVQILPLTPKNKNNMVAWLVGRSDSLNYGELLLYRLPKDHFINGPRYAESKIDQEQMISAHFSLWKKAGSEVIRGNMLTIPVGKTFLQVEPIYLSATGSPFPKLIKVVVVYNDRVVWGDDLAMALSNLFGHEKIVASEALNSVLSETNGNDNLNLTPIQSAKHYYDQYYLLMGQGKPQQAGEMLEKLGGVLSELAQ